MSWNYRVIKQTHGEEDMFAVHEVFYDDAGAPVGWSVMPVNPVGEGVDDLRRELVRFHAATRRPVLEWLNPPSVPNHGASRLVEWTT